MHLAKLDLSCFWLTLRVFFSSNLFRSYDDEGDIIAAAAVVGKEKDAMMNN